MALRHNFWKVLGVKGIHVVSARTDRPLRDAWVTPVDARFRELVRQHRGEVLLIRPDRYVAAAVGPHELGSLAEDFERLLRS